jgi:Mg-chelatase subunit ChlD
MSGLKMRAVLAGAKVAVGARKSSDLVGVISFDTKTRVVVAPLTGQSIESMKKRIESMRAGGGTDLRLALEGGLRQLAPLRARRKHVVLLTDGQSPRACIGALVRQMRAAGLTVSTVGIGDVDAELLALIAKLGGGRFHKLERISNLGAVLSGELHRP